jgi:hypothetical protein
MGDIIGLICAVLIGLVIGCDIGASAACHSVGAELHGGKCVHVTNVEVK